MIIVEPDDEAVYIVEQALAHPERYLAPRHRALEGVERQATAVVMALWWHTYGTGRTEEDPSGEAS